MKSDVFHYHYIYTNFGANQDGQIYNKKTKRVSIGNIQSCGYRLITLNEIGLIKKGMLVHRLVYECFHGPIPDGMQINHIDSNRQNNCINNLESVTPSENVKHANEAKKFKTKIKITSVSPLNQSNWILK